MIRNYKISVLVGSGIPLLCYLGWLAYFSLSYESIAPDPSNKTLLYFAIGTTAIVASMSFAIHLFFSIFYVRKLSEVLRLVQGLNARAYALTEDLSEISAYHQEQIELVIKSIPSDSPCSQNAQSGMAHLNEAAEELSLRIDKTASEVSFLHERIKALFPRFQPKVASKKLRLWESAYFYR